MKFIYSTIEGRLYAECYPGRSEIRTPAPPAADTAYIPVEPVNATSANAARSLLYPFEAETEDEALIIAERLKAFASFADIYHEQEVQKWHEGRPTDNEKAIIAAYKEKVNQ